jgi:hypothetical protein
MAEATIGDLANLETATATDRGVAATLTEENSRLVKKLEDCSNELKDIKTLFKIKEQTERGRELSILPQKLLLDSWIQGGKYPHKHKLQLSQAWSHSAGP